MLGEVRHKRMRKHNRGYGQNSRKHGRGSKGLSDKAQARANGCYKVWICQTGIPGARYRKEEIQQPGAPEGYCFGMAT